MAYEEQITFSKRTALTASDLSANQYYAVTQGSTGLALATTAKAMDGILLDNAPGTGVAVSIAYSGVTKACIAASQTVTGGVTMLEVNTDGTLIPHAAGIIVAKALESVVSVAAVTLIAVELLPANALFS